ncbi:MAG: hypothetical protein K9H49_17310 [Bacteroidales bacterium]|nr:hypothetical protein [Bacteroidales bacterium]MCF8391305.1 hypothetical protein [Bacteroidales bacterium]
MRNSKHKLKEAGLFIIILILSGLFNMAQAQPGSAEEPVVFTGDLDVNFQRPDGELDPLVGAQNYQVLRSVKNSNDLGDGLGFTFHHHPMLSYWQDQFYVLCNACPTHEERGLTEILLMKSQNGIEWSKPEIIFPHVMYNGEPTFCNHRMGFYITPGGKLLASTAYFPQSEMPPQSGSEDTGKKYFGVVVREIKEDGSFGPIYFIAQNNSLYKEEDFPFPYFTKSKDKAFIAGCEALRSDKLITLHWWEQIRPEDFNYPPSLVSQINNGNRKFAKAISYFHRDDTTVVALWKSSKSAISYDNGNSWSKVTNLKTFSGGYAKVWGQRTEDGKFAASWRPLGEGSWGRYPMLWASSKDGIHFDNPAHLNGEVTRRYDGGSKDIGPCNYQRGLYENGADIPGDDVWVVYSMSKEDIWISRIPVPLKASVDDFVNEDFNQMKLNGEVQGWNIYHPKWAPVGVSKFPSGNNKCLKFMDKDPFDYAKAFKIFKETDDSISISFKLMAMQNNFGRYEVEVGNTKDLDPVKIIFSPEGEILVSEWNGEKKIGKYDPETWNEIELDIDISSNRFKVKCNGTISDQFVFNSRGTKWLNRITFRTGINRGISINPVNPEEDLPLEKSAVYYLDDVKVNSKKAI